jgi:ribonuclease BN (tRNA processing enzyme)
LTIGSLTLTPRATQHYIPCWGFRVEGDGRRLSYTADTAPSAGLSDLADGADLLLSEATLTSLDEDAQPPEPRGHLTPAEAGSAARDGGAGALVLTHLPVNGGDAEWARAAAEESYGSNVEIAEPDRTYEV